MLKFLHLTILCLLLTSATSAAAAGFTKIGSFYFNWEGLYTSGRLSTLGGSDMADKSPAALLVNPAPLFTGNGVGLSYDHAGYFFHAEFHTYAGAAEWNDWRLNIAVQDFVVDSAPFRTAYNPEGTGKTYSSRDRMVVIGLGYDLGGALFEGPAFSWSVGAAWRRYSVSIWDVNSAGNSLDLGTTFSSRAEHENGWTGLTGAVSWQNVTEEIFTYDGRLGYLPHHVRTGLTLETAFRKSGGSNDLFKLLMAYTRVFQLGETLLSDTDHAGVEALFYNALAVRYGHNTRFSDGIWSWGIGIVLDGRILGPFTVEADWGEMNYEFTYNEAKKSVWGVRARYNF